MLSDHSKGTSIHSLSINSLSSAKYGGLLEENVLKIFRKDLTALMNYIYSVSPPFYVLHIVMIFFRILQFLGPSLCVGYIDFWRSDETSLNTLKIVSIFFNLIPPQARDDSFIIFLIIYFIITAIVLVVIFTSAKIFKRKASLPKTVTYFISIYISSFGLVIHLPALVLVYSKLYQACNGELSKDDLLTFIVFFILTNLITIVYSNLYTSIMTPVLTFQPTSFLTATTYPQNVIIISQNFLTVVMSLGDHASKIPRCVILVIGALAYLFTTFVPFLYGGLIRPFQNSVYLAAAMTGFVMTIIILIFNILESRATFTIIGIFVLMFIIFFIISHFWLRKVHYKRLQLLDQILDDNSEFSQIKTINQFVNLVVTGFVDAHPMCITWQLNKYGIEFWPKKAMAWYIYAKFVSIYPEETQTLAWILIMIFSNKVKGKAAKIVKEQSLLIARQRETNLSSDLKAKLNLASKHITSAKHKLRHVWDLALQGNISDMENSTRRAITEIQNSDAELLHIYQMFPNNRFVVRQYTRFCRELLADQQMFLEMHEKVQYLQRGININKDQAHEFGIHAFPQLPDKVKMAERIGSQNMNQIDTSTASQNDIDQDEENPEIEDSTNLKSRIESLIIPSTRGSIILRICILVVIFVVPVIALLIFLPFYIDNLIAPLNYMYYFTLVRSLIYQAIDFSEVLINEYFGLYKKGFKTSDTPPKTLGGTWETRKQLAFIGVQLTEVMQKMQTFQSFQSSSKYIKLAQEEAFSSHFLFKFYDGTTVKYTEKNLSMLSGLSDIVLQQAPLVKSDTLPPDVINSSAVLNPIQNLAIIANSLDALMNYIVLFIAETSDYYQNIVTFISYFIFAIATVIYIVSLIIEIIWINRDKRQVFSCFTALPKNAVSTLAENLRVLKKETENSSANNTNTEMNKQEDNIMKIFITGGSGSSMHIRDAAIISFSTILVLALHIICTYLLTTLLKQLSYENRINSPHLNNLGGSYANYLAATSAINMLVGYNQVNTSLMVMGKTVMIGIFDKRMDWMKKYYHLLRFGGQTAEEPPFSGYAEQMKIADSTKECPDKYQKTEDFFDAAKCYSTDDAYVIIESVYHSRMTPFKMNAEKYPILQNDDIFRPIWALLISPIYEYFISPMTDAIIPTMKKDLEKIKNNQVAIVCVLFIIAVIIEIVVLIYIGFIEKNIRNVLKLLMLCPSKVLLSTPRIMSVLSGDFSRKRNEFANRTQQFFHDVVQDLPNAVLVANVESKIIDYSNKSFTRIFGLDSKNGESISDFLTEGQFVGEPNKLIISTGRAQAIIVFKNTSDDTEVHLDATSMIINQNLVIEFRDITRTVRYNTLINEEKCKSDILLSSILPASLVKRVQAGEKNISFAVQTATIVFMDIVSFTPWCGSLPADKVMSTLNNLFKKFDALVSTYPTMTKIKCIGDCYMAAGGVFSEVNQPSTHAKEVVMFGLDSIKAIGELNQELEENLQIRVGINTGGPIVAGVLGIGKPTFEILGPAINMAQQMEHHGVPMQVHISRTVYELIYGDSFVIKERGSVEVKNGSVITYLVNAK